MERTETIEELGAEQREADRNTKAQADVFLSLIAHPGWKEFCSLIEKVGANYFAQAVAPLENIMEATKPEYAKGTLNGLQLAASLPQSIINAAKGLRSNDDTEE